MEKVQHDGLCYYQSTMLAGTQHGIFTRHGGTSQAPWASLNTGGTVGDDVRAVHANHKLMYDALDVNQDAASTTWQVHGADVVIVNGPVQNRRWLARADGMITNKPDLPLVMRYADCVPLIFHDPVQQVIGLSHAGWRGTVQGMAANTIRAMVQAYESNPADVRVVIGPSISIEHYQVGEEVVDALHDHFADIDGLMRRDSSDGTAYIDLWEANKRDLLNNGVSAENIEVAGICTYANTDDFFSHRAEKGKTGRFGVVISL